MTVISLVKVYYDKIIVEEDKKKACAYVRVSSYKQVEQGESLPTQIKMVKDFARIKGYDLKESNIYIEEGVSAYNQRRVRHEKRRLFKDIKEKKFDVMVVVKTDRVWRRNVEFQEDLTFLKDNNCHIISVKEGHINTDSALGWFILSMTMTLNEMESRQNGERVRDVKDKLGAEGKFMGCPVPKGYDGIRGVRKGKRQNLEVLIAPYFVKSEPSDLKRCIVENIFKDYLSGISSSKIAKKYGTNSKGVLYVLGNPLYVGFQVYKPKIDSEIKKGDWEAYITVEQFNTIQKIRKEKCKVKNRNGRVKIVKEKGKYYLRPLGH